MVFAETYSNLKRYIAIGFGAPWQNTNLLLFNLHNKVYKFRLDRALVGRRGSDKI